MPRSTSIERPYAQTDLLNVPNMIPTNMHSNNIPDPAKGLTTSTALIMPIKHAEDTKINPSSYHALMLARDFNNWLAYYRKRNVIPFSSDHLLTLMFFNVIRAHGQNTYLLGLTPANFAQYILSPFNANSPLASKLPRVIPPTFYPTHIQKTIPHHPELDMLPWPQIRDKMILAQGTYDDYKFCEDMVGMECPRDEEEWNRAAGEHEYLQVELAGPKSEPGLIVWNDPWKADSWEASEAFVQSWGWILVGCRDLLQSTNYWREQRGEEPLVWEV